MKKEDYDVLEMVIICFETEDIITDSGQDESSNDIGEVG